MLSNLLNQTVSTLVVLLIFFLLLFGYTKFAGPLPFSVNSVTTSKSDSFNVTGEGKVSVKPDLAVIRVGVVANGTTVAEAQDGINSAINKVSAGVKSQGVDPKDIQTENYNIYPNYDNRPVLLPDKNSPPKISSYTANTNIVIKVRDLTKANEVIDSATKNGANQVGGIDFQVSDKTKAQNDAREIAVKEAKAKAAQAAKIAGFSLGKIINYSESFNGSVTPVLMQADSAKAGSGAPTQVEAGTNEVKVDVTLSYEVR